jgi:1,4-dihydroxy-2-naphthoyl-CoA hydrolase
VSETKSIWFRPYRLEEIQTLRSNTLVEHLDIRFTELGPDYVVGTMPVDERTRQPGGILHGGASVALAETLGSVGANLCIDSATGVFVGQEINANHLRPIASGLVTGTARPIHRGRRSHVWQIELRNPAGQLTCISRLTLALVERGAQ